MSDTNKEVAEVQEPGPSKMAERLDTPEITKDAGAENLNKDVDENEAAESEKGDPEANGDADPDIKSLDQVLEDQRIAGKNAFQDVIDENVRLEHELKKVKEQLAEVENQRDTAVVESETESEKRKELQVQIEGLQNEVTLLKQECAAAKEKQNGDESTSGEMEATAEDVQQTRPNEQKVKDLQVRLLRMVKDAEEKDKETSELKDKVGRLGDVIAELKPHVDAAVFEEVMAKKTSTSEESTETQSSMASVSHGNTHGEGGPKSKVCIVM